MSRWCLLVLAAAACSQQTSPAGQAATATVYDGAANVADGTVSTQSLPDAAANPCLPCVDPSDCPAGQLCGQFLGSSYCAAACGAGKSACPGGTTCGTVTSSEGEPIEACVPMMESCSGGPADNDAGSAPDAATIADTAPACATLIPPASTACCACSAGKTCAANGCYGGYLCRSDTCKCVPAASPCPEPAATLPPTCGSLDGPATKSCCACKSATGNCAANGCYGNYWCNRDSCLCQQAPQAASCADKPDAGADTGPGPDAAAGSDTGSGPDAAADAKAEVVNPMVTIDGNGGTLDSLDFAIVGDTRPPAKNDTALYPTAVITKIWQGVQAESPVLPFAITTGDYQFSSAMGNVAATQLDLYLGAQKNFAGLVFHTLGNHECTGATTSNCGLGNKDGVTTTYKTFLDKMLAPLGHTKPYYTLDFKHSGGKWTARFIFVAANAWDAAQATWLEEELKKPATYILIVRHEGNSATEAPGVTPSNDIIKQHVFTHLIVGHAHTYEHSQYQKQVIVGLGGAPLASSINYGYAVVRQRPDMALQFTVYDYATHATIGKFAVAPSGQTVP